MSVIPPEQSLIEYPSAFPIKVMGRQGPGLAQDIVAGRRKPVKLVLIGLGKDEHTLRKLVHEFGLEDRVRFRGTRLPADQIWRIVAYVKSMRTEREPDKPESFP